jgi:hypothetical protein
LNRTAPQPNLVSLPTLQNSVKIALFFGAENVAHLYCFQMLTLDSRAQILKISKIAEIGSHRDPAHLIQYKALSAKLEFWQNGLCPNSAKIALHVSTGLRVRFWALLLLVRQHRIEPRQQRLLFLRRRH